MEISDMLSSLRNIFNIKAEQIAQYVGEQVKYYFTGRAATGNQSQEI